MAINLPITVEPFIIEDKFSGEECKACKDCIYGIGFRVVIKVNDRFSESEIVLCQSCKDALKW